MQSGGGEGRADHANSYHSYRSESGRRPDSNFQPGLHFYTEQLFHDGQQSLHLQEDQQWRARLMFEQKRMADAEKQRSQAQYPLYLPMMELKKNRVTLCMEVSGAELLHASKFTSSGMAALLKESEAIIRLPERFPLNSQFINQVTITGELHQVELVRRKIRDMGKISVTMPLTSTIMNLSNAGEWLDTCLKDGSLPFPSLVFSLRRTVRNPLTPMLDIVGAATEEQSIVKAVNILREKLYRPQDFHDATVFTIIDFAAANRECLMGKPEGTVLVAISKETGATVHFPTGPVTVEGGVVTLTLICSGTVESILAARNMIMGLLPVQLCLNIDSMDRPDSVHDEKRRAAFYRKDVNVSIRIEKSDFEPKMRLPRQNMRDFIVLSTHEFNINESYILAKKFVETTPLIVPICPLFTPSMQAIFAKFIGELYPPCSVDPTSLRLRRDMLASMVHKGQSPSYDRSHAVTVMHQANIANYRATPTTHHVVMPQPMHVHAQQSLAMKMGNRTEDRVENEFGQGSVTLLQLSSHADGEVKESSHIRDRKNVLECVRHRLNRETPKHTLELKARNDRGQEGGGERRTKKKEEGRTAAGDRLIRRECNEKEEKGDTIVRSSYAQVLQEEKPVGRMDPLRLIELAGEESEARERATGSSSQSCTQPINSEVTNVTTYASVARAAGTWSASEKGTQSSATSREELDVHGDTQDTNGFAASLSTSFC